MSETLETLDERWKAGAFRYLMPDFRARVHRGETFLIAGDRFAIGSSREMSPAGLKAVAEEAGLRMVVVCGGNMGDIFRRNALNLGLEVVQSPEAVADARDGDEFSFEPATRRLTNESQGKTYDPLPLTVKEDEIRRSGGIFAAGRREFRSSVETIPRIEWPDAERARRMTSTEQIIWAHRVDKDAELRPGATLRVYADLLPASDGTAPFAIHTFNQIAGGDTIYPRQAAIANDHFVFTGREDDEKQTSIGRAFARGNGLDKPDHATPGDGIFHFYFPEQGLIMPGQFIPGADSHSRAYGAYGAVGMGVGSTTLGFGWATGYVYFTLPKARRVVFTGRLQPWVSGKDIVLELLRRWGTKQSQGMSVELVDARPAAADRVSQHDCEHDGRSRSPQWHLRPRRCDLRVVPRRRASPICRIRPSLPARTRSSRSTRRSSSMPCSRWWRSRSARATRSAPRKSRASASRSTRR